MAFFEIITTLNLVILLYVVYTQAKLGFYLEATMDELEGVLEREEEGEKSNGTIQRGA